MSHQLFNSILSAGLSRLTLPPCKGKEILAQGKRRRSATLGARSNKNFLPRPIGWGEGRGEGCFKNPQSAIGDRQSS